MLLWQQQTKSKWRERERFIATPQLNQKLSLPFVIRTYNIQQQAPVTTINQKQVAWERDSSQHNNSIQNCNNHLPYVPNTTSSQHDACCSIKSCNGSPEKYLNNTHLTKFPVHTCPGGGCGISVLFVSCFSWLLEVGSSRDPFWLYDWQPALYGHIIHS